MTSAVSWGGPGLNRTAVVAGFATDGTVRLGAEHQQRPAILFFDATVEDVGRTGTSGSPGEPWPKQTVLRESPEYRLPAGSHDVPRNFGGALISFVQP